MATWDGYNQSIIANRFQKSFMVNYVDLSGRLLVRQDVSMNNRLFVMNDASFMGNVYVDDILTANLKFTSNNDVSFNNRFFVMNDASFMGNVYVDDILTANLKMISIGDTSFNSNVFVGKDISCNGNINIGRNLTVFGNLAVKNYTATNVINTTTTNYSLAVVEDISLNGRLSVSSDSSLNGNLFVSRDMSFNGKVNVNSSVSIVKDISVNGMRIGRGFRNDDGSVYVGNLQAKGSTWNTAVGYQSLDLLVDNNYNSAIGYQSAYSTSMSQCTAVGYRSLYSNTTGAGNSSSGYQAGYNNTTGSNNTYIGYGADASAGTYSNSTAVGANSSITGNNQIVLGRPSETVIIPRIERFGTPVVWDRRANGSQVFNNAVAAVIDWSNEVYKSPLMTSLTYSAGTFTNNQGHQIYICVSVSYAFATNGTGDRAIWIEHSNMNYFRMSMELVQANGGDATSMTVSGNFSLSAGESFKIIGFQSSGGNLGPSGNFAAWHPCRITITQY